MGSIIDRLMFTEEEKTRMFFQMLNKSENDIIIRFKHLTTKIVMTYNYEVLYELHKRVLEEEADGYAGNLYLNIVDRYEYNSIIKGGTLKVEPLWLRVKSVDFKYASENLIKWRLNLYDGVIKEGDHSDIMLETDYYCLHKHDNNENNETLGSFIKLDQDTGSLYTEMLLFNTELIKDMHRKSLLAMDKLRDRKR